MAQATPLAARIIVCGLWLSVSVSIPAGEVGDATGAERQPVGFTRDVVPALTKAGCNMGACHGSFQGRGGFRLSLLGFDPAADYEALVKEGHQRRLFPAAPEQSLILAKPVGRMPHGGGKRFEADDPAYVVLRQWIEQGLPGPSERDPRITKIEVNRLDLVLEPGEAVALEVQAHWSDGLVRDVTGWAQYEVRDERIADVSPRGEVKAVEPGRTAVTVRYSGQVAAATVTVPYGEVANSPEFPEHNFIDRHVAAEWEKVGLQPAPLSDDYEFVRRVCVDLIGTLPTPDEVTTFVSDQTPDKRARLIEELFERPEYVDYWTYKWGDLLRVHRRYTGDKALWTFHGWIRRAVRENWPLDKIARDLLTARGNLYTDGPVAYFYTDQEPELLAETTAQVFLGVRLQCARCHHHPYEIWSQEDYYGLANFFTRFEAKDNGDGGLFGGAKLLRPTDKVSKDRRPKMQVMPAALGHTVDPQKVDGDIRVELAEWVTSPDNPFFARNFVNRYWSDMMGRGLVDPVDDQRATNPPSHPALMDALAKEFVDHGYDARHLLRLICNSRTYQLASVVAPEQDRDGMFYSYHSVRWLPAAVLHDAVHQAAGVPAEFDGLPPGTRAVQLPDPAVRSHFLDAFGRSQRASPCECASSEKPDLAQALHLINSERIHKLVTHPSGRIVDLVKRKRSDELVISDLYLATISRPPTAEEMRQVKQFVQSAPSWQAGYEDLLWTLLNSSHFVFNH